MKNKFYSNSIIALCFTIAFGSVNLTNAQVSSNKFDSKNETNSFFDNSEVYDLKMSEIFIDGEVLNPSKIDLSKLQLRELIVKETIIENGNDKFIGAFRYMGYSVSDILNAYVLQKKNANEFPPLIDMYVEIENDKGEKVVISWGELYYSNHFNEIIIASKVARIIPEKSKDMWTLPSESKLIVFSDLLSERNISNPTKITVKSYGKTGIEIIKGKKPLYSPKIDLVINEKVVEVFDSNIDMSKAKSVHTIFYGKGRGLHSTEPFNGISLKNVFDGKVKLTQKSIRQGLVVVVADDGYRTVYTFSELSNRNDQAEVLLICNKELKNDGIFRLYPSCDFFSDRAIKGIAQIIYVE